MKKTQREGSWLPCLLYPAAIAKADTLEETQEHITEAIELYVETLQDNHQDAPEEHLWQGRAEVAL
jgi:hypothetical protein